MSDQSRPIDALISDLNVPSTEPEPRTNGANGKPKDYNQLVTTALESLSPPVSKDELEKVIRNTLYENGLPNYTFRDIKIHWRNNQELIKNLLEQSKPPPEPPRQSDIPSKPDPEFSKHVSDSILKVTEAQQRREQSKPSTEPNAKEIIDEAKAALTAEQIAQRQKRAKALIGVSLNFPYHTPNAILILQELTPLTERAYTRLVWYMDIETCSTKPRSREDWAKFIGVKKPTWRKIETTLRNAGLIGQKSEDDTGSHKQKVSFSLPYIRKWQRGDTDISPSDTDISPSDTDISLDSSKT